MDYMTTIERIGFPIFALCMVGFGIWRILVWIGTEIVQPIAKSHIELVESTKKTNELNTETASKIVGTLSTRMEKLDRIEKTGDEVLKTVKENNDILTKKPGV